MKIMIFILLSLFLTTISASLTRQTCVQTFTGFHTLDVYETESPLKTGEGDRFEAIRIEFGFTFCNQPKVSVFTSGFDFDQSTNQYFDISAENIDTTGFTLVVHARSEAILNGIRVSYIADDIPRKLV